MGHKEMAFVISNDDKGNEHILFYMIHYLCRTLTFSASGNIRQANSPPGSPISADFSAFALFGMAKIAQAVQRR